jgi:type I restriction-modification system DNA methylase subunit
MINNEYSELTLQVTKSLTKTEKKEFGIFNTPNIIIQKLIHSVDEYSGKEKIKIKRILEPSCGTCEIINYCDKIYNGVEIVGIEYHEQIFTAIKDLKFKNNVTLLKQNFMGYNDGTLYDLIVGNPPYFVCKKGDIPEKYHEVFLNIMTAKYSNKVSFGDNPFSQCLPTPKKRWFQFWKS